MANVNILLKHAIQPFIGSEKQKAGTERVIRYLIDKKPSQWTMLQKKYDPENLYYTRFRAEAEARGIKV